MSTSANSTHDLPAIRTVAVPATQVESHNDGLPSCAQGASPPLSADHRGLGSITGPGPRTVITSRKFLVGGREPSPTFYASELAD